MSFDPFSIAGQGSAGVGAAQPVCAVPIVLQWLETAPLAEVTRDDYRRCLQRLKTLPATSKKVFALDWAALRADLKALRFDPGQFASVKAQDAWARKVVAAFKGASGELAAQRERRARQDDWADLTAALEAAATSPFDGPSRTLVVNELIPLGVLADLARRRDLLPRDLTTGRARDLYLHEAVKGQRETVLRSYALLDRVRDVDWGDFSRWLPPAPIGFEKPVLAAEGAPLPAHLEEELRCMVELAARGKFDATTGETFRDRVAKPIHFAAKKVTTTGLYLSEMPADDVLSVAQFFDKPHLTAILRQWQDWEKAEDPRAIAAITAAGYFQRIKPFLERNGYDGAGVAELLSDTLWLQDGLEAQGKMTKQAERFCKRVLRNRSVRIRLLSLHIDWRKRAMAELDLGRGKHNRGGKRHLELARQYGTIACFAAIETDAAPIRVDNALNITSGVPDAWLVLPTRYCKDAELHIPASVTKNRKSIDAPMRADSPTKGLQTVQWYLREIRPLFPHAEASDFLFPAVTKPGQPLSYSTFAGWWYPAASEADFPELTPHKMRHAQASILVAKNPGNWQLASVRLGDTEATAARNYGFVDRERLMTLGHQHLTEDFA